MRTAQSTPRVSRWRNTQRALLLLLAGVFAVPSFALVLDTKTTIAAVRSLSKEQALAGRDVEFEGVVTWFSPVFRYSFIQDGENGIFVYTPVGVVLQAGDRVLVRGRTHAEFSPDVIGYDIVSLGHGALPPAPPASFDQLMTGSLDCRLVRVTGHVQSADLIMRPDIRSRQSFSTHLSYLQLKIDGGDIDVLVNETDQTRLKELLDADVEVTAVAGGRFDSKWHQTGVILRAMKFDSIRLIQPAATSPWSLPLTPMGKVLTTYHVDDDTRRVRVEGTVTYSQPGYYRPGSAIVLQNGSESLWLESLTEQQLHPGDVVSATGFADVESGSPVLTHVEVEIIGKSTPVAPFHLTSANLIDPDLAGKHHFDLVSIEGRVVTQVREAAQDKFVLDQNGLLFSAIVHHPDSIVGTEIAPMPIIAVGSTVRVTGICLLKDAVRFSGKPSFDILMGSFDDLTIVANPPFFNTRNLLLTISVLLVLVGGVVIWNWTLRRKVNRQTLALARRAAADAAKERRNAELEQQRSRILEDINTNRPLAEILEEITDLLSLHLNGAPCWCEVTDGARLGDYQPNLTECRLVTQEIPGRSGPALGMLFACLPVDTLPNAREAHAFLNAARVASLAIETRRLYNDLVHRSEFDLLTEIHNRFSLEKELDTLIENARLTAGIFGLVFVDLDDFKQVNDTYGHHIGDLYLQQVAARMKKQLRSGDLLARLGGDEFAVLVPSARTRSDVEEVAHRLQHSFEAPFAVEGYSLTGSASIGVALYPEDGATKDSLLSSADAAMYVAKEVRHQDDGATSRSPFRRS